MYINNGGTWKSITDWFINVSGTWKRVTDGFINVAGTWKRFFTGGALKPQFPVSITKTINSTTGLATFTGRNWSWTPGPPLLTYYFEWSTDGFSWTTMTSGNAVNPSYGSYTDYTYTVQSSGSPLYFSANTLNLYRFRVDASYGQLTGTSDATETIQGPTNITLSYASSTQNSISLSWTASTGANRYMVYYSTNGSTYSLYAGTSNLSITVSGLSANTYYYFKVMPITGTTNGTGYNGNYSNVIYQTTAQDLLNTALPTISGTIQEGNTVTATNGSWTLTPDSYSYQWLYYNGDPGIGYQGYVSIAGATSQSYTIPLTYRDVYGQYLRVRVTANKNGYTSKDAYSVGETVAYDATLPQPPTGLSVTDVGTNRPYGNVAYNLSWTAPTNNGGSAIIGYKVEFQVPSVDSRWYPFSSNATDTSGTSVTLSGFGSNLSTNFRVYSVNSVGQSTTAVATTSPVLGTTVPQAPTIGTATTTNGYVSVGYTANATGGKSVTSYTATSSPDSITGSTTTGNIFVYNLTHNQPYTFTVTATNANGTSLPSAASNTVYGVNIGAPVVNSYTATSNSITLYFTPGTNSTSTRGLLNGSLDGLTSSSQYLFGGLGSNTTYALTLQGSATVNGTLYLGPQTSGNYTTAAPAPGTPTSLTATTNRTDGVNLTFSGSSGATSYDIFWNVGATGTPSSSSTPDFTGVTSPYLDTTISAGGTRYYWVRGRNASGTSAWYPATNGIQGSRLVAVSNATAPTTVNASGGNGTATVSWSGATNAVKYRIWWSTSSSGNGVDPSVSYDAETTNTSYTFNLSNGTTYYFWVSASNTNNVWTSYSLSPRATATPTAPPPSGTAPSTPTGLTNSYSSGPTWTGSWSASSGTAPITYYWTLLQSTTNGGTITRTATGSTTGTSFTRTMDSADGLWAYFTVYATNAYGTSGSATSGWA